MLNNKKQYPPSASLASTAHINAESYEEHYQNSLNNSEQFWGMIADRLDWYKKPTTIKNTSFEGDVSIKWYEDGILNSCYNCVDRHLPHKKNDIALIWEADTPDTDRKITYGELKTEVCKIANALKHRGIKKGDRVTIYMPMVLEAVYAMLACARIGAIHSVVFGGFSPESLKNRIRDCKSELVITADEGVRGGKKIPLKNNTDEALKDCPEVHTVLVFNRTNADINIQEGRDFLWDDLVLKQNEDCPCEQMNAEDPLFILYTSGSTGKPKGVLHTTGGYMVYASYTHEITFDYQPGEIYWCTADVGWITGHSYIVYGPLANGATTLIFEGVPHYPDWSRFWQIVDKHSVNIFYTAPTAIRSLIKAGDEFLNKTDRSSLRILGTVGEPINSEAWHWYYNIVGKEKCPIVDTWWQTETGGHMLTPLPGATMIKPGSACTPFFGVEPAIVDKDGHILNGECEGAFCILSSWPGQMRTLYGDHKRFVETYFTAFPGKYFTGDGAKRDKDGYYWITGRMDDVINVSGHRLGTAEIESAIDEHSAVAEAAVVGFPHDIKGQGIYAFITLCERYEPNETIKQEIINLVRKIIGPIATPDIIQWAPALPKTRSGKIMRRILRKIAIQDFENLGDISTLAEPDVIKDLKENAEQHQ